MKDKGGNRTDSSDLNHTIEDGRVSVEQTVEEALLAALLMANADLLEALKQYDDLERVAIERQTEERSRKEVRMERKVNHNFFLQMTPLILVISIEISRICLCQSYRRLQGLLHHILAHILPSPLIWLSLTHNILRYRWLITTPSS
jgi:hypothetical protein